MKKPIKKILLDADVISHFISCNELLYIAKILTPHEILVLDYVYHEIARIPSRKVVLDNLLSTVRQIRVVTFPTDANIRREFALIKKNNPLVGDGERACMSVAKFDKDIIASSNYRDIIPYCVANGIQYLGTLDILSIALQRHIFDIPRCNRFISLAKSLNNARFPRDVNLITDYTPQNLSFI